MRDTSRVIKHKKVKESRDNVPFHQLEINNQHRCSSLGRLSPHEILINTGMCKASQYQWINSNKISHIINNHDVHHPLNVKGLIKVKASEVANHAKMYKDFLYLYPSQKMRTFYTYIYIKLAWVTISSSLKTYHISSSNCSLQDLNVHLTLNKTSKIGFKKFIKRSALKIFR